MADRNAASAVGNLPAAMTSFIGRRREITQIRGLLAASRLVTLTGVGGVGKTRLALQAAAQSRGSFPGGVWLVDLAPVRQPERAGRAVVTALGIPDQSARPAPEQLISYLSGRQALIVLDNCEHLLDACAVLADELLRGCARLRILATSRQALGITGEFVFLVPPLAVPGPGAPLSPQVLGQYEAVNLFTDRAVATRPDFALNERNSQAVGRLCARLDGIPLAIELAATRLRSLPVEEVDRRLADRFGLLTVGSRAGLPRQRTLRALIDWSYDLCSAPERLLWTRLSVFAGGFDLDAAAGVCADDRLPASVIIDLIDQLVAQSVVLAEDRAGHPRYRMLETIREYGWERLTESGDQAALGARHRDYFAGLAERIAAGWVGPGQEAGLAALRLEHGNVRAALQWSVTSGSPPAALALVSALRYHWCADGFLSEARRWLDQALAMPGPESPQRVTALWVAAWAMLLQGDYAGAEARLTECDALAGRYADSAARGQVVHLRGTSALFRGRLGEAIGLFEQATGALEAASDDVGVLMATFQLGIAMSLAGDERAPQTCRRAIMLSEKVSERLFRSYALWALGFDAWMHAELDEATALTRAALLIQQGFNDHPGTALMIELLAWISASQGDYGRAGRLLGALRAIWRTIGTSISVFGPHIGDHHARCERFVIQALPAEAWQAALSEGGRMDHDQAISYALGQPESAKAPAPAPAGTGTGTGTGLTRRELEVAGLVAQGLSNRKIAECLVVSPRTVDGHVEHILAKLGFTARAQIAAWVAASQSGGTGDDGRRASQL